ncbi:O-antigen ligase family protein [Rufibacter quisquiliarum]|uniref:O-antigen ligase-related domain-containing protein n=1 Tax=Rufibacter quisquiliarum TaxID=1549639 RepID=A0A839GSK2_9BACT|nr:O-antigen ligase family protein [Rufibacter quisquiliarum]MBA9077847.1 hypothetical protein [Rufibacter quisquiliarum]
MAPSYKISASSWLVTLLLLVLLFSGFITNFLSFTEISLSTIVFDLLIFLLLLHTGLTLYELTLQAGKMNISYVFFAAFWFFLFVLTLIKTITLDVNPLLERLFGIRNNLVYAASILYVPLLFRKERQIGRSIRLLYLAGILLCLFAIFQFIFSFKLPMSLLVLRGEVTFSFVEFSIVRPTALLGNTIIFASFTIILFCILLPKYLYQKRKIDLFYIGITLLANVLTYTRAALFGAILSGAIIYVLCYGRFTLNYLIKLILGFSLLVLALVGIGNFFKDSFLVRRVTGVEVGTIGSTDEHFRQIFNSIDYLKEHVVAGAGIGTQGQSGDPEKKIVTDGYWFQLFLENGLPLGSLYFLFFVISVAYSLLLFFRYEDQRLKQLCLTFIGLSAYFFAASLLNSALSSRVNFFLYWLLFSFLLAQQIIVKNNKNALHRN